MEKWRYNWKSQEIIWGISWKNGDNMIGNHLGNKLGSNLRNIMEEWRYNWKSFRLKNWEIIWEISWKNGDRIGNHVGNKSIGK